MSFCCSGRALAQGCAMEDRTWGHFSCPDSERGSPFPQGSPGSHPLPTGWERHWQRGPCNAAADLSLQAPHPHVVLSCHRYPWVRRDTFSSGEPRATRPAPPWQAQPMVGITHIGWRLGQMEKSQLAIPAGPLGTSDCFLHYVGDILKQTRAFTF